MISALFRSAQRKSPAFARLFEVEAIATFVTAWTVPYGLGRPSYPFVTCCARCPALRRRGSSAAQPAPPAMFPTPARWPSPERWTAWGHRRWGSGPPGSGGVRRRLRGVAEHLRGDRRNGDRGHQHGEADGHFIPECMLRRGSLSRRPMIVSCRRKTSSAKECSRSPLNRTRSAQGDAECPSPRGLAADQSPRHPRLKRTWNGPDYARVMQPSP